MAKANLAAYVGDEAALLNILLSSLSTPTSSGVP